MELRQPSTEERDGFDRAAMWAFHRDVSEDDLERWRRIDEHDRQLAWFEDERIVATTLAYSRLLTVPGGAAVPSAGVSAVTVVPTHRRRGLLTSMMRRQLADIRDRGEPLAMLWASEGPIYGRFGFGVSVYNARLQAQRPRARLTASLEPLRGDHAEAAVDAMRAIHERVRVMRAGMVDRPGSWWEHRLRDPPEERAGAQALRVVFAGDEGYALYAVKPGRDDDGPSGEVQIRELMTTTAAARGALWAFLLDQDLTRRITWQLAPVDEPLRLVLADPFALTVTVQEALWVRIIDVEAALRARSYTTDPDVVLDVADPFCDWVAGRYRLSADDCARTDARADLELDAAALGAVYLGATTFLDLAAAGRVRELSPGAVERASRAFRGDVPPWCPEIF
jgi:predicted acetyltransferase